MVPQINPLWLFSALYHLLIVGSDLCHTAMVVFFLCDRFTASNHINILIKTDFSMPDLTINTRIIFEVSFVVLYSSVGRAWVLQHQASG